jgi:hypothetical protein
MAVILPLLAVYGGVTAGISMAAAGAATFAGALAVAGGMAAGLGIVTKDKDFQRLGSILSAASGIANAAQGLASGAGNAADAANAADGSIDAAESAKLARQGSPVGSSPAPAAPPGAELGSTAGLGEFGATGDPYNPGTGAPAGAVAESSQQIASNLTGGEGMADAYKTAPTAGAEGMPTSGPSALQEAAASMTKNDIVSMLERGTANAKSLFGQAAEGAGKVMDAAGNWVQKNPHASNLMFKALEGMYGPQSEQMDYERGLLERARRNVNSPVRLQYQTPKTVGG